jgi:hypothetical protein
MMIVAKKSILDNDLSQTLYWDDACHRAVLTSAKRETG